MMHLLAWMLLAGSIAGLLITLEGATGMYRHLKYKYTAWRFNSRIRSYLKKEKLHTHHAPASSASREAETDDEENKDE